MAVALVAGGFRAAGVRVVVEAAAFGFGGRRRPAWPSRSSGGFGFAPPVSSPARTPRRGRRRGTDILGRAAGCRAAPVAAASADAATFFASEATSAAADFAWRLRLAISFLPLPACAAASWASRWALTSRAAASFFSSLRTSRVAVSAAAFASATAASAAPLAAAVGPLRFFDDPSSALAIRRPPSSSIAR